MIELTRTVRMCVPIDGSRDACGDSNGFGGIPAMAGMGAFFELHITCRGNADPQTGYLAEIGKIDLITRRTCLVPLVEGLKQGSRADVTSILHTLWNRLNASLPVTMSRLRWNLTPTYSLTLEHAPMQDNEPRVRLEQQFEFAASHRLHVQSLSDEENKRRFGKCNNPNGHGHNYRLGVSVDVPLREQPEAFSLSDLEALVNTIIMPVFDHKHLNVDVSAFASLNPSVEHIAGVIYNMLQTALEENNQRASLHHVTVWETEKTSATYPAS